MINTASNEEASYDIAIIGAGPAGCAAALTLLLHSNLRVILFDRLSQVTKPGETVQPGIIPLLEYLKVDASFLRSGHSKVYGVASAWGDKELLSRAFMFGMEGHGWHLNRNAFELTLRQEVKNRGGELRNTSVRSIRAGGGNWSLFSETAGKTQTIKARFLIDASGRLARFGRKITAEREVEDKLVAAFRFINLCEIQDSVASSETLIESVENGWWYSAGLPDNRLIIAYFSDSDLMRASKSHRPEGWLSALAQTNYTRHRLSPKKKGKSSIQVCSACSHRLMPSHGANWIAAGDAAMGVDPLSSMGIGLALLTGIHAARVGAAACAGEDVSGCGYSHEINRQYEKYLELKRSYYAQETRWRKSPFWKRRV